MQKDILHISKQQQSKIDPSKCININIGVLGHVDSGKTALCRILSEITSTAALDKNPQSQQRGITLDLGFSAFIMKIPQKLINQLKGKQQYLQFTLVDCPGHASLLKTIIGGAQIIDMMFLVIDITKGIQTQTAQCIIIAQLFINKIIIILNKIDMLEDQKQIQKKINSLRKVFQKTKFGYNVQMVPVSTKQKVCENVTKIKQTVIDNLTLPERNFNKNFLLMIDHCFKIKGKGNIITGTVIQGKVKPGDQIQICQIQQKGKIKYIQMFKKPLTSAKQGDRVAMLITQIQSQKIQRGLACLPGSIKQINKFVIDLNLVRLYKRPIKNKAKFHIISGHQTVMSEVRLFCSKNGKFDPKQQYLLINQTQTQKKQQKIHKQEQKKQKIQQKQNSQGLFMIVSLQKQMYLSLNDQIVGYKFDIDAEQKQCRIAFHGKVRHIITQDPVSSIKLYKQKQKTGVVDRLLDNYTLIIKDLFDKTFLDIKQFIGKEITIEGYPNQKGKIDSSFGKSGKVRVVFKNIIQVPDIQGKNVYMKYLKWYN